MSTLEYDNRSFESIVAINKLDANDTAGNEEFDIKTAQPVPHVAVVVGL